MRYRNREEAGKLLATALMRFKPQDVVVLAVPRGGLPLGAIVAKELNAPLDVALAKKIGHPYNQEYAIGAVSLSDTILTNAEGVSGEYIQNEVVRIREKLRERHAYYHSHHLPVSVKDKVVILVDDGLATGNTMMALTALIGQQKPSKIIVAVPVAPPSTVRRLQNLKQVDEVVCLQSDPYFQAVGQYYEHFYQVSDEEAIQWLDTVPSE